MASTRFISNTSPLEQGDEANTKAVAGLLDVDHWRLGSVVVDMHFLLGYAVVIGDCS